MASTAFSATVILMLGYNTRTCRMTLMFSFLFKFLPFISIVSAAGPCKNGYLQLLGWKDYSFSKIWESSNCELYMELLGLQYNQT